MNIQAEKIEIMKLILETDNPGILESIKTLFKEKKTSDFWETLNPGQKKEILEGLEDIKNGDTINYEDFIKEHL